MSRSQQSGVLAQAKSNSSTDQSAATSALSAENAGIGNYEAQLSQYATNNPFLQGGQFDKATSGKLAGIADAGSGAITNQLQMQADRTGQNAGAATATAAEAARANLRTLGQAEAAATQQRIGSEADYNKGVVSASEVPAQLRAGQYATSLAGANSALNTAEGAARQPGFWDTLGNSFAGAIGNTAGGGNVRFAR